MRPSIPLQPGRIGRRDYEYKRCGTANVFCGIEPKAGVHFTKVTPTRSSPEFADFLLEIAEHYPAADIIHLVVDNLSTHTRKALVDRFGKKAGGWLWQRFTVHYTPKHGSWLNQAEIEISLFSRQCLGNRRIGISLRCADRPRHGITKQIVTASRFSGSSPENWPAGNCITHSRGHGTSILRCKRIPEDALFDAKRLTAFILTEIHRLLGWKNGPPSLLTRYSLYPIP